jgi:hypothetical protein
MRLLHRSAEHEAEQGLHHSLTLEGGGSEHWRRGDLEGDLPIRHSHFPRAQPTAPVGGSTACKNSQSSLGFVARTRQSRQWAAVASGRPCNRAVRGFRSAAYRPPLALRSRHLPGFHGPRAHPISPAGGASAGGPRRHSWPPSSHRLPRPGQTWAR